jgi:hypothetical protein
VPHVAWPGVPPLKTGLFWQSFSEVVSFGNSLVQVVSSVKNSEIVYAAFSGLVQSIIQQEAGEDQRTKTAPVLEAEHCVSVSGRKAFVPRCT